MQPLFTLSAQRALESELPSCIKSFLLPYAYVFTKLKSNLDSDCADSLQLLSSVYSGMQEGDTQEGRNLAVSSFLAKWIDTAPSFTNKASELSYMGLSAILRVTQKEQSLASLTITKPRPSWMSDEVAQARPKTLL